VKRTQPPIGVTRRQALKTSTVLLGSALLAPVLLAGCAPKSRESAAKGTASPDQALLEDIADTLLPTTAASPGAKAAGVGATMVLLLNDCMEADVQQRVANGLQAFRATCRDAGGDFASLQQPERERLLRALDVAAQADKEHWFAVVRELALWAYFSSEVGLTQAMRYEITPGRWDPCLPLQPGQPAWG
jgi:glucoside 3-dehydrogenase (cytochrome c) hitch-hiker subunit